MHELKKAAKAKNSALSAALERHLKKWYPESVSSLNKDSLSDKEETDSGGAPVAPISIEATKINIENNFRLSAIAGLKEQIKEFKEHESK